MNAPDPNPSHVDLREATPTPVKLVEYSRYVDAQRAVDTLSDEKFQMNGVTIVWSGLRKVEHVTGRRTVATAARDGLMSGAWFGLIIGLLFSAFTEGSESTIATVLIYSIVGAITVAAFQAFQHWAQRGTRDFSTIGQLDAEQYEIWVEPDRLTAAQSILKIAPTVTTTEDTQPRVS